MLDGGGGLASSEKLPAGAEVGRGRTGGLKLGRGDDVAEDLSAPRFVAWVVLDLAVPVCRKTVSGARRREKGKGANLEQ